MTRSLPKILGVIVAIYFATNFLPILLNVNSSVYELLNPARYVYMLLSYFSKYQLIGPNAPTLFNPASIGLTPVTLLAAAVLWIIVPFGAFLYMSVKRD
ncbi:MAG: hypothetical protein JRN67_02705 [Nitrososphaerota archaeon]|nr:hypothetical protein [Nitrososphaerota archaeon]